MGTLGLLLAGIVGGPDCVGSMITAKKRREKRHEKENKKNIEEISENELKERMR